MKRPRRPGQTGSLPARRPYIHHLSTTTSRLAGSVMRVLLTGGYGFIGAWIIKNLLARGDQVWVYDLQEDPRRLTPIIPAADVQKVVFVPGDVTNQAALRDAIA